MKDIDSCVRRGICMHYLTITISSRKNTWCAHDQRLVSTWQRLRTLIGAPMIHVPDNARSVYLRVSFINDINVHMKLESLKADLLAAIVVCCLLCKCWQRATTTFIPYHQSGCLWQTTSYFCQKLERQVCYRGPAHERHNSAHTKEAGCPAVLFW